MQKQLEEIDEIARDWDRTKDPKFKDLWYKKIKEVADGINTSKRRVVSISSCHKANDGGYVIIGKSRLL
jgi:hypothetical protein|tara:strand:+ start:367 stop:573 length:207 start_codon:yes stop_codon:yes gene_type:complete